MGQKCNNCQGKLLLSSHSERSGTKSKNLKPAKLLKWNEIFRLPMVAQDDGLKRGNSEFEKPGDAGEHLDGTNDCVGRNHDDQANNCPHNC